MKWTRLLLLVTGLFFAIQKASAQAAGLVIEQETLYNGVLSIEYVRDGYGNFDAGDRTRDYDGVSIGNGSAQYGCVLADPNGSSQHNGTGVFNGWAPYPPTLYMPVNISGYWKHYASFFLWFWPCDSNCVAVDGNTYDFATLNWVISPFVSATNSGSLNFA
jgi:hypothetical protein